VWCVCRWYLADEWLRNVSEINETLPTMSVISGKKPHEYAQCLAEKAGRQPWRAANAAAQGWRSGDRSGEAFTGPAAVFDIEDRSGGSSIKLHERMSNVPFVRVMCNAPPMRAFPADRLIASASMPSKSML
jgi:hypothetical protein